MTTQAASRRAKKAKGADSGGADGNRWLSTYGDMVTLLMAFFVMLFAVSETDNQKFDAFVAGLAGPFQNSAVIEGLVQGDAFADGSPSPLQLSSAYPPALQAGPEGDDVRAGGGEADVGEGPASAELARIQDQLEEALGGEALDVTAQLRRDERGLAVSIATDDVLFETASTVISPAGRQLLETIAPVLREIPNTVVIEGHTDDRPLNRGGYTNWNLSTDRAVAVLQLFGDELDVPYDRLSAAGFGEFRPVVPNDTPEHRSQNRRVEILIVAGDPGAPPPAGV